MQRRHFLQLSSGLAAGAALGGCNILNRSDARFRDQFDGQFISKTDLAYEDWRDNMAWQMNTARRYPDYICRPNNEAAIREALKFAHERDLKVVCKSGGHNVANSFMRNSGMLLDLSHFNGITLNQTDKTAWVDCASWSWQMSEAFEAVGLSFPYAHCASVPMGGYLLGGGIGINGDAWSGMGCHTVRALKIMLANGDVLIADETQNTDLFWAARGGGTGFFGTVLAFKIQLFDAPTDISERYYFYPLEAAAEVANWLENLATICPKSLELMIMYTHRPPTMTGPRPIDKKMCFARLARFAQSPEEAAQIDRFLDAHQPPGGQLFAPPPQSTSMRDILIGSVDPNLGLGFGRYNVETIWTNTLADSLASVSEAFVETPSHKTHILASPRHGVVAQDNAAFSMYASSFIGIYTVWDEPGEDDSNRSWAAQTTKQLGMSAVGRYVNELDAFTYPEKLQTCFAPGVTDRLEKLRRQYDPKRLFFGFPGQEA